MLSYAAILDAIGLYLEYRQATDALINEIDGGFMVGFMIGNEQRLVTLSTAELTPLHAEAVRHPVKRKPPGPAERLPLRTRLLYLGRYLDRTATGAVVAQERASGFTVEYTAALLSGTRDGLGRLVETLDDAQLGALA